LVFESLDYVSGSISVDSADEGKGVAFPSLTTVVGSIEIGVGWLNDDFRGLSVPLLGSVGGSIHFWSTEAESLDWSAIEVVQGDFSIMTNAELQSVVALFGIQAIGGDLAIVANQSLPTSEVTALVDTIGPMNIQGSVTVSGNGPN